MIVSERSTSVRGGASGAMAIIEQRPKGGLRSAIARSLCPAILFAGLLSAPPACIADQIAPLTVERPPKQTMVLTQGFSTTIHSERPFGKISITDPEIVDLVLRTDKSAVLIPQRTGRTNIDFLDDHGTLIGSMDVTVVRQGTKDRIVIYNRPSLGAYSTFHCGQKGCEHFEEIPNKEEALTPNLPQDRNPIGMPPQ
jgi:Pilus formation protein N terminal region